MEWVVTVVAAGPPDASEPDDDQLETLLETLLVELSTDSPVVTGGPAGLPGWSATITVPGEDARFAAEQATSLVETWAAKSGLPAWPVVRVDAVEASILDRELADPSYPELVGIAELAELAGVSQQRASVLASRPDFPKPIARLRSGPVFDLRQVSSFVEKWPRRPGRPAKAKQRARV